MSRSQNLREMQRIVQRFSGPGEGFFWHQNITGVELEAHQLRYYDTFETDANVMVKGSRRVGKSFPVASWLLREAVTKPFTEVNIFAPALEQSKRNLQYMEDFILRSKVLQAFLEKRAGGTSLGKERIRFRNGSVIQAKGQASSVDGLGSTHIWLEELDDMDWEALWTRIMPTGAMLKKGYDYGRIGRCQIIATGTIKGQFNLYKFEYPDPETPPRFRFTVAPVFDCWYGVAAGMISEDYLESQRVYMTDEAFARTYLCLYTESSNFFPTRYVGRMMSAHYSGNEMSLDEPAATGRYRGFGGKVLFGIDMAGQGQQDGVSSNYSIVFVEMIRPDLYIVIHAEEFDPLINPMELRDRIKTLMRYYQPVKGTGDAYDANLIFQICKDAYDLKLHRADPRRYVHGPGEQGWDSWFCTPINMSGPRKHSMYMFAQRRVYERGIIHAPLRNIDAKLDDRARPILKMIDQMEGIISTPTQGGYDKYGPSNKVLGDDLVDALTLALEAHHFAKASHPAYGGAAGATGTGFQEPEFADQRFQGQTFKNRSGLYVPAAYAA